MLFLYLGAEGGALGDESARSWTCEGENRRGESSSACRLGATSCSRHRPGLLTLLMLPRDVPLFERFNTVLIHLITYIIAILH